MNILFVPLCVFGLHQIHISVFPASFFLSGFLILSLASELRCFCLFVLPRFLAATLTVVCRHCRLVGSSGVEPPTSCLSGMRSNLLSYEPLLLTQPRSTFDLRSKSYEPRSVFSNRWWRWRDSNPWPPACRAGALPAELHPHIHGLFKRGPREPWKLNNKNPGSVYPYTDRRSLERRWSSRTFRYGYLVTT